MDTIASLIKMDKTAFSVASLFDESDEKAWWLSKSPYERLQAVELMRQVLYGYKPTAARLQRFLKLLHSNSGLRFEECYKERTTDILDEVEVNLISLNHLKVNKKASGRLKDLTDLEYLP
jgi:hypothetical protein